MKPPTWQTSPAVGSVLAKLAELYLRAQRLDAARRAQRAQRLGDLLTPRGPK